MTRKARRMLVANPADPARPHELDADIERAYWQLRKMIGTRKRHYKSVMWKGNKHGVGRTHTAETRAKLSAIAKQQPRTPHGHYSPARRAAISRGVQAYHDRQRGAQR